MSLKINKDIALEKIEKHVNALKKIKVYTRSFEKTFSEINSKTLKNIDHDCETIFNDKSNFGLIFFNPTQYGEERVMELKHFIHDLIQKLEHIKHKIENDSDSYGSNYKDIESFLHTNLKVEAVINQYNSNHYKEAVFAAYIELEAYIRKKAMLTESVYGESLMTKVFSERNPILKLIDKNLESQKSMQIGYMNIFQGVSKAIRNPKAHSNFNIDKGRALHFLFLISLLFYKVDETEARNS